MGPSTSVGKGDGSGNGRVNGIGARLAAVVVASQNDISGPLQQRGIKIHVFGFCPCESCESCESCECRMNRGLQPDSGFANPCESCEFLWITDAADAVDAQFGVGTIKLHVSSPLNGSHQ